MGHGPVRPIKHVDGLMGTVDVVLVIVAVVHHISWAAVRPGPSKHMRRLMGLAERPLSSPHLMSRGPARPIKISEDRPRLGPAHHIFKRLRPGLPVTIFRSTQLGPAEANGL